MRRNENNPIITRKVIPEITEELSDVSAVFNPGAVFYKDKILLLMSVETRGGKTHLVKGMSDDGIHFKIEEDFLLFILPDETTGAIYHVSDPRITFVEERYFIVCTVFTESGSKLWITTTTDFEEFEEIGFVIDIPARSGVLLPEKINGKFTMLFSPEMKGNSENGIFISQSEDFLFWNETNLAAKGNEYLWDEFIFPGPPPIKTKKGWLQIYGAVKTKNVNSNIYQAGAVLLDLKNPSEVIARTKMNFLEPRESYELIGRSPGVVLPTGLVVKKYDDKGFVEENADILIYYGAAQTSIGLLHTSVAEIFKTLSFDLD